jgi:hypothetical protein
MSVKTLWADVIREAKNLVEIGAIKVIDTNCGKIVQYVYETGHQEKGAVTRGKTG